MKEWFIDSYNMKWKLKDHNGISYWESFDEISLADFEVIYGNNSFQILECHMEAVQNGDKGNHSCSGNNGKQDGEN